MGSHEKFLKKLFKRGAIKVEKADDSEAVIVFVPIVSRFETDINSALSNISGKHTTIYDKCFVCFGIFSARYHSCFLFVCLKGDKKVIVVALHHTYDPNYTVPHNRKMDDKLVVNCLFYEKKGLLSCPCNKKAKKMVCEEVITQVTLFFKQKVLDTQIQINMDSSGFASFLHVLVNNNTDQTILVSSHWLCVPGGQYVVVCSHPQAEVETAVSTRCFL